MREVRYKREKISNSSKAVVFCVFCCTEVKVRSTPSPMAELLRGEKLKV